MEKDELIKFWKSYAAGSESRNFLKDCSTLGDRVFFHNLVHISEEKQNRSDSSLKFYRRCISLDREVLTKFCKSSMFRIQTLDLVQIRHVLVRCECSCSNDTLSNVMNLARLTARGGSS